MVLDRKQTPTHVVKWEVIDGRQRLTHVATG